MASILTLADGTELAVTDGSTLSELRATFDNAQAAINFYYKLNGKNTSKVTFTKINGEKKEYLNRVFGVMSIETDPSEAPIVVRFSLRPSPAPQSEIINSMIISDLEKEIESLKVELDSLKLENRTLANKAEGYDIIIGE